MNLIFSVLCIASSTDDSSMSRNELVAVAVGCVDNYLISNREANSVLLLPQATALQKVTLRRYAETNPIETICWTSFYREMHDDAQIRDATLIVGASPDFLRFSVVKEKPDALRGLRIPFGGARGGNLNVVCNEVAGAGNVLTVTLIAHYADGREVMSRFYSDLSTHRDGADALRTVKWSKRE